MGALRVLPARWPEAEALREAQERQSLHEYMARRREGQIILEQRALAFYLFGAGVEQRHEGRLECARVRAVDGLAELESTRGRALQRRLELLQQRRARALAAPREDQVDEAVICKSSSYSPSGTHAAGERSPISWASARSPAAMALKNELQRLRAR